MASAGRTRVGLPWAAQFRTLPHVVFGNSSTSAPPLMGGSNPRHYYVSSRNLALLYEHYTHGNVYVYPEHLDHDLPRLHRLAVNHPHADKRLGDHIRIGAGRRRQMK